MSKGIIWVESDRLMDQLHCQVVASDLAGDDAEKADCVGVSRLDRKDLAVDRFGFGQPPGLVVLGRDLKRLRNRHGARVTDECTAEAQPLAAER
jgi:hypothetical protein